MLLLIALSAVARLSELIIANYPETVANLLIVRAPRVFPLLWQLVSCFFDPNTRKKIIVYGGNDYQVCSFFVKLATPTNDVLQVAGGLKEFVPQDFIPDFLSGPCQVIITVLPCQ